jgi:hypothetical protein
VDKISYRYMTTDMFESNSVFEDMLKKPTTTEKEQKALKHAIAIFTFLAFLERGFEDVHFTVKQN